MGYGLQINMVLYKTLQRWSGMQIRFAVLIFVCLFAGLFALAIDRPADAATTLPTKMNFQGRITNASGSILANGTYNMRFKIYDAVSGGAQQWSEDRLISAGNGVTVTNGQFSVQLGSISALNASVFASNSRYFEVELPTPASATTSSPVWTELPMTPRNQLATTAYAYNAETLDGIDGAAFAQMGQTNAFTGANTFSGTSGFTNTVDINAVSTAAFQVRNGATNLFSVNSTGSQITIGTSDTTGTVLVLDTKTNLTDPTGVNGAMYYNSNLGKFRCYQNGAWTDCIGAGAPVASNLQDAYNASGSPATIWTTGSKGIQFNTTAAPTTDLFSVVNTTQPVTTADANGIQVDYAGGAAAVEGSGIKVNYTPGSTSGGIWNGLKIVAGNSSAGVSSNGLVIEGPATGNGTDIGLRVASGFDIGLDIASGGIQLSDMDEPSTPATAGDLRVYAKTNAGRTMLKIKGNSGVDVTLQPFLGSNRVTLAQPFSSSTSFATGSYFGMAAPTIGSYTAGTTTASTAFTSTGVSFTNLYTSIRRGGVNTSTGAGTSGGIRGGTTNPNYRGNGNATGGFYYVSRFGVKTSVTGSRVFSGLYSSTAAFPNSEPSALLNIAGVGCDIADNSFNFISNDNSGTAAKVSLGANFPCNTSSTDMYELRMFNAPSGTTLYYSLARLNTTDLVEGSVSVSANLPVNTTAIYPYTWINNGTTAAQASLDFASLYIETDN